MEQALAFFKGQRTWEANFLPGDLHVALVTDAVGLDYHGFPETLQRWMGMVKHIEDRPSEDLPVPFLIACPSTINLYFPLLSQSTKEYWVQR